LRREWGLCEILGLLLQFHFCILFSVYYRGLFSLLNRFFASFRFRYIRSTSKKVHGLAGLGDFISETRRGCELTNSSPFEQSELVKSKEREPSIKQAVVERCEHLHTFFAYYLCFRTALQSPVPGLWQTSLGFLPLPAQHSASRHGRQAGDFGRRNQNNHTNFAPQGPDRHGGRPRRLRRRLSPGARRGAAAAAKLDASFARTC